MSTARLSRPTQLAPLRRTALQAAATPWWVRASAGTVYLVLGGAALAFLFVPWTQTVRGKGRVVAGDAVRMRERIDAPVSGRIARWLVPDGARVKQGTPVALIEEDVPAARDDARKISDQAERRKQAAAAKAAGLQKQLRLLEGSKEQRIAKADGELVDARERLASLRMKAAASEENFKVASEVHERRKSLFDLGLAAKRDFDLAELKYNEAKSYVDEAHAQIAAAANALTAAEAERAKAERDVDAQAQGLLAELRTSQAEAAAAETVSAQPFVDRTRRQPAAAPRDGVVLRSPEAKEGAVVQAGTALATYAPESGSQAVELFAGGADAQLVYVGAKVRLQFEGFTAVQFTPGWPSKAIGTFGGVVQRVEPTEEGIGRFRVRIVPDPDLEHDSELRWPSPDHLKAGARANGWMLLREVSLGYEVWRRVHGFPVVAADDADDLEDSAR